MEGHSTGQLLKICGDRTQQCGGTQHRPAVKDMWGQDTAKWRDTAPASC